MLLPPVPARSGDVRRVAGRRWWWLRARAWLVWRLCPGAHPIAELIARGEWAALDRLLTALEGETLP
jgi:hypothetical protein